MCPGSGRREETAPRGKAKGTDFVTTRQWGVLAEACSRTGQWPFPLHFAAPVTSYMFWAQVQTRPLGHPQLRVSGSRHHRPGPRCRSAVGPGQPHTPIRARLHLLLECGLHNRMLEEDGVSYSRGPGTVGSSCPSKLRALRFFRSLCASISVCLELMVFASRTNTDSWCFRTVSTNSPSTQERDGLCIPARHLELPMYPRFQPCPTKGSYPHRHYNQRP